jgi:hypothetical protein
MPPAATSALPRRALAGLALAAMLVLGGGTAAWAQDPTATTVPPTSGVLVTGTTVAPTSTPASTTSTTAAPEDDEGGFLDLDANEKVWVIVAALVGVAIVMMVLTVLYWRHTRPGRGDLQDKRITKAERKTEKAERKDEKRRRRAVSKDPFVDGPDDALVPPDPADGPMDLEELLGEPDPSRSVFGSADEDPDAGR